MPNADKNQHSPKGEKDRFYHSSAPVSYDPRDYGATEDDAEKIWEIRRLFSDTKDGRATILKMAQEAPLLAPSLAKANTLLYAAMCSRPNHQESLDFLRQCGQTLAHLDPEAKSAELFRCLQVNLGNNMAITWRGLTGDLYYSTKLAEAAMDLANNRPLWPGVMGNWTAHATAAEYRADFELSLGKTEESIVAMQHKIFRELKDRDPQLFLRESNLIDYLSKAFVFSAYRKTDEYKQLIAKA